MARISTSSSGGNVNIQDTNGDALTSVGGSLNVNVTNGGFTVQDLKVQYNQVAAVAVGVETVINNYTAPIGKVAYLINILSSGENRGQFNVYNNGVPFDTQYTNVTMLTVTFDYKTGSSSVPGFVIPAGTTIVVTATNAGNSSAMYNSRFLILEVS